MGLDKIYTREEIEKAKQSPSFEREYNLKYLGLIGNTFHTRAIEAAVEKGKLYNPDTPVMMAGKAMGIDPAWGSSAFGVVVIQWVDGQVQVLHAEEYLRPDYNEMLDITWELIWKYNLTKIYVDGANPAVIRSLKQRLGENSDYETESIMVCEQIRQRASARLNQKILEGSACQFQSRTQTNAHAYKKDTRERISCNQSQIQ